MVGMVKEAQTHLDSHPGLLSAGVTFFRWNAGCGGFGEQAALSSFRPREARAGIQRPYRGCCGVMPAERSASSNPKVLWGLLSLVVFLLSLGIFSNAAFSQPQLPDALRNVGIDQRLDEQLPLDIEFRNEEGRL